MWSEKNPLLKDLQKINESHYHYEVAESYYPQEKKQVLLAHLLSPGFPTSFCTPKRRGSRRR